MKDKKRLQGEFEAFVKHLNKTIGLEHAYVIVNHETEGKSFKIEF